MNRNKLRRQSRSAAVFVPAAALLVIALTIFGMSVFLKIMHIEVNGARLYSEEDVIDASEIASGSNLLFINKSSVSDRIFDAMPYISEIKITRVMPDLIRIEVKETSAIASIRHENSTLLIDSAGRVLECVDDGSKEAVPHGLIEIVGFTPVGPEPGKVMTAELGDETRLQYLKDVLASVEGAGIRRDVAYIDISSIANITLGYTERFRVVLGSAAEVSQKLRRLPGSIDTINEKHTSEETGVIDMSDISGGWRFTPDR